MNLRTPEARKVIPEAMIPDVGIRQEGGLLFRRAAWFIGMDHAQGEFSSFFLSLRDEQKIYGNRCSNCEVIIIPPFMQRCEHCNFVDMKREEVKDTGVMLASPPIVLYAPSGFKDEVPYAIGRVYLDTQDGQLTDTAMSLRCRTTTGPIRPGIFTMDTPVKVVFATERKGEILDIFLVPQSELTEEQLSKSPLLEHDLVWDRPEEVQFPPASEETIEEFNDLRESIPDLGTNIAKSPRAIKNLKGWQGVLQVVTEGGRFSFEIKDGGLELTNSSPDLTLTFLKQSLLADWLNDCLYPSENPVSIPLSDLFLDGSLRLSANLMEPVANLDRLVRSLRRDTV